MQPKRYTASLVSCAPSGVTKDFPWAVLCRQGRGFKVYSPASRHFHPLVPQQDSCHGVSVLPLLLVKPSEPWCGMQNPKSPVQTCTPCATPLPEGRRPLMQVDY